GRHVRIDRHLTSTRLDTASRSRAPFFRERCQTVQKEDREVTMRKDIRRRRDAHVRTSGVCTEHHAIFDTTAAGRKRRTGLAACVADGDRLLAVQKRAVEDRRASTEQIRRSRRALGEHARAIVKIGRVVDLEEPLMATMQFPGTSISDDDLLAYV